MLAAFCFYRRAAGYLPGNGQRREKRYRFRLNQRYPRQSTQLNPGRLNTA